MPIVVPEYALGRTASLPLLLNGAALTFNSTAQLNAQVSVFGSWAPLASFTIAGLAVTTGATNSLYYVHKYLGERNVPSDIRRLRKSAHQVMQRMGQPVIVKHMFNDHDAKIGIAQPSPTTVDGYGQVRAHDPYSYGTGYCSVQLSTDEWINTTTGTIITATSSPGSGYVAAPYYRGYGPGYLTYIIEPDVPLDMFKLSPSGAIIKIQSQTVVSAWFPEINDNDLIINAELDNEGHVVDTHERYQAKLTRPITIRGLDRKGRQEYSADHGNRHVINQQFEMNLLPETSTLYSVETDR